MKSQLELGMLRKEKIPLKPYLIDDKESIFIRTKPPLEDSIKQFSFFMEIHSNSCRSPSLLSATLPTQHFCIGEEKNNSKAVLPTNYAFFSYDGKQAEIPTHKMYIGNELKDIDSILIDIMNERPIDPIPSLPKYYLSPLCPLSYIPIQYPGRGSCCNHHQCFDLREFLLLHAFNEKWYCPICKKPLTIETLRFDPMFFSLL